ncbi:glycosyltransferase family 2 protein [archaeon]|jgi:glycosyltransferase involved in cell wall biosynthesis|nr:glycosyltransferase family 2 protein [archaeon]
MKKIKFSIIIPARNEEEGIERAINSIQKQTHKDFEVIISNDGSTDKTREIVEGLIKKDKRIRILNRKEGRSAAFARNRGAEKANGEIIVFLDADTFLKDNFLEEINKCKSRVDGYACDCFSSHKTIVNYALSGMTIPIIAKKKMYSKLDKDRLMFFCVTKKAYKKIGGYSEEIFYFEDEDFANKFYDAGFKSAFIKDTCQYFELPSTFSEFIRQSSWIAKGLNSIKDSKKRRSVKFKWLAKSIFLLLPLFFLKTNLALLVFCITAGIVYLNLIIRNKNLIKSLVSLPFLYVKTIFITSKLIIKSFQVRLK